MPTLSLVLRITAGPHGLTAHVLSSPVGQTGSIDFTPPLTPDDLARVADTVATEARRADRRHVAAPMDPTDPDEPPPPDLLRIGRRLSDALFQDAVAEALHGGLAHLDADPGASLRIEIRIDPSLDEAPALHALPWELLIAPRRDRPLALSRRTPVVRYLETPHPDRLLPLPETLRILVVAPRPRGTDPLDQDLELRQMRQAWNGRGAVSIEVLDPPTLETLRDVLRDRPPHALHFMGHGHFEPGQPSHSGPRADRGELLFEDEHGEIDGVSAETLAGQVEDFARGIQIVVLNACQSARFGSDRAATGVAAALVEAGIPAVVAMQLPVTDRAAVAFGRELYRRLAAGDPVDLAVSEGRQAIRRQLRDSPEWVTPALFLRARDGLLFARPEATADPEPDPAPEPEPTVHPEPRRVAPRRSRLPLALAAVTLVAGLLAMAWLSGARPGAEEAETGPDAALTGGGEAVPRDPAEDDPTQAPPENDDPEPAGDRTRGSSVPTPHQLAAGESAYLPEAGATVTVDFVSVAGLEHARIAVSPDGGRTVAKAAYGPATLEVDAGGRTVRIDVLAVDLNGRRVTLRAAG